MARGDIRKALGLEPNENLGKHRTYRIWKAMKSRCFWDGHEATDRYQGKGVQVCDRWMNFLTFLDDMGHPPTPTHSIDRKDTNGNYEPNNCRWATNLEQSRNRVICIYFDTPIGRVTMTEAAAHYGIDYHTVWKRHLRGWPLEKLFSPITKIGPNRRKTNHA